MSQIFCVIVYHEKLSIKHPEIQVYYYYYCYLNIFAVNGKINECTETRTQL